MTEPPAPIQERGAGTGPRRPVASSALLRDAGVVLGWFLVAGVVGALVWWQVTPLAEYTRTATTGQMGEDQLGREVAADGWYTAVAAVGGVLSGLVLTAWRRRDPLATVLLVAVGALLAAWVMRGVGLWVGPPDPDSALRHTAQGARVPMRLETHAGVAVLVWPVTALLAAVGVLWGLDDRHRPRRHDE